jgi:hypothetical protein
VPTFGTRYRQAKEGNEQMIRSLKAAFGLSLLAALALSAMSVMSASATDPGPTNHFTSSTANTKYTVTEATGTAHSVTLHAYGGELTCHKPQYAVHHTSTTTFTTLTVTPINDTEWGCTDKEGNHATVHFKGCHYQFTAKGPGTHATIHFKCPVGVKAEVTLANGSVLKFKEQTPVGGATYVNTNGEVTANITATGIHVTCHGICQILGTTRTDATMVGAAKIAGFDTTSGAKSHLTAT